MSIMVVPNRAKARAQSLAAQARVPSHAKQNNSNYECDATFTQSRSRQVPPTHLIGYHQGLVLWPHTLWSTSWFEWDTCNLIPPKGPCVAPLLQRAPRGPCLGRWSQPSECLHLLKEALGGWWLQDINSEAVRDGGIWCNILVWVPDCASLRKQ